MTDPATINKRYPFKFLDAYGPADKDFYFGRDEEIKLLYRMLMQSNLVLLFGLSGTGKTSLIHCGLASRFSDHEWLPVTILRGNNFYASLISTVKKMLPSPIDDAAKLSEGNDDPVALTRRLYLQTFKPVYLVFDQFEQLFILGDEAEEKKMLETVEQLRRASFPVKVIIAIREEYIGYLVNFEKRLPEMFVKKLRLEPMAHDDVKDFLVSATAREGSLVTLQKNEEDEICAAIFEKVKSKQKTLTIELPYLQVFLDKLYKKITGDPSRTTPAVFSREPITQLGEIKHVLRDFLNDQVVALHNAYPEFKEKEVWAILSPFASLEGTRQAVPLTKLDERLTDITPEKLKQAISFFVENRVLRVIEVDDENAYEPLHDSLAKEIAEKRSVEQTNLLEAERLIKALFVRDERHRDFLTEKQLDQIEPHKKQLADKGKIDEAVIKWIEASEAKIRYKRLLRIILSVIVGAVVLFFTGFQTYTSYALRKEKKQKDIALRQYEVAEAKRKEVEVLNYVKSLKSYGDEMLRLDREQACKYYQEALDSLKGYESTSIYSGLQKSINSCAGQK